MTRIIHLHCFSRMRNRGDLAIVQQIQNDLRARVVDADFHDVDILTLSKRMKFSEFLALARASLIVVGGGGIFSNYFPVSRTSIYALRMLRRHGIPIVTLGPGFGGSLKRKLESGVVKSAVALSDTASLCSVRDTYSQQILMEAGVGGCVCIGDPALHCLPAGRTKSRCGDPPLVGFNMAAHRWRGQREMGGSALSTLLKSAKMLQNQGYVIRYFVHSDFEDEIATAFSRQLGCEIVDTLFPCILQDYQKLSCFVGVMLHSTILACAVGCPFVSLGYDLKNRSFMEMMDLDRWFVPLGSCSPEALTARILACMDEWPQVASGVAEKQLRLRNAYNAFVDKIADSLN